MKIAIALLALVAVAVANPVGPLVTLIVNVNSGVPAGDAVVVEGVQETPAPDAPIEVVDVMPVIDMPVIDMPINIVDVMPVIDMPAVITPVMPVVDPIPPSAELAPPVLPILVQPEAAVNLPEILN